MRFKIGDRVEVFYQYSWKAGAILGIVGGEKETNGNKAVQRQYLVRLIGCSEDLVIGGSNIRMRRMWDDEKWVLMGKVPQCKSGISNLPPKPRTLKRTSPYVQKLRSISQEKVDAVAAYPKEILARKNMCASYYNIKSNRFPEVEINHVLAHSGFKSSELISSDTDACSVGSCDIATRCQNTLCSGRFILNGDDGSDVESFYSSVSERKKEFEVSVRGLELHAYRTTLEALYASGPLSWEQEAMLTNLRIMLHISNDEHLKELKYLISTKAGACAIR